MSVEKQQPPILAERFLTWFLRNELAEEVLGDLEEQFYDCLDKKSASKAKFNYWYQVFHYLRPFAVRKTKPSNQIDMLRNYHKIAWRNLIKYKSYSAINVFGLSVGIACFLLLSLYIYDEFSFDSFHTKANDIYRVVVSKTSAQGVSSDVAATGYQVGKQSQQEIAAVDKVVQLVNMGRSTVTPENDETNAYYEDLCFANQAFLDAFDFELINGDRSKALTEPNTVILTREMAMKLFGTTAVLDELILQDRDSVPYKITAVLKDFPSNSHLNFSILYSDQSIRGENLLKFLESDWQSNAFSTYLVLNEGSNPTYVAEELNTLLQQNVKADESAKSELWLQPLKEIHFNSAGMDQSLGKAGHKGNVLIILVVALFVLVIACINYINLTTARFATRTKEIGMRKVSGARRANLITQLLTESMLITLISFVGAIILVQLSLPYFNNFTEKDLAFNFQIDSVIWIGVIVSVLMVALLSGLYPALFQSKLDPVSLFRPASSAGNGSMSMRQGLVIFQFCLSIFMIASTIVMFRQMDFMSKKSLGFNQEQLIVVDINSGLVRNSAQAIKNQFAQLPEVTSVALSSRVPGEWKQIPKVNIRTAGADQSMSEDMYFMGIDEDFLATFEMDLIDGISFPASDIGDSTTIILNETAAKMLDIKNAENQVMHIPSVDFYGNVREFDEPIQSRVMGIVKDFNFKSLHEPVAPMVLAPYNNPVHRIDYFIARFTPGNTDRMLESMENVIHSVDEAHLFEFNFLDQKWEQFYRDDRRQQSIFIAISCLTIVIACLGLFGLTAFMTQQRIKEIGIRKVLGASASSITMLMSQKFIALIGIALLIATPLAWFFLDSWLENYAYRIDVSWWVFPLAGIGALSVALFTISFQTLRAAMLNPVTTLRTE